MVNYVDTMNGYELRPTRLGEPFTIAAGAAAASALLPVASKGLEVGFNAAGTTFQNWLPAVTGATGASIFAKGIEDMNAADAAVQNERLIKYALGIGGAVILGLVIYKAVKS